jgi:ferritin-like protein
VRLGYLRVDKANEIIGELRKSYGGEFETLQNYLAHSIDLEGPDLQGVRTALEASISPRLKNLRRLARRINVLGGRIPGSLESPRAQHYLQPAPEKPDAVEVIQGVLRASENAIAQYEKIIGLTEGNDFVTQDLLIDLLSHEREQHKLFNGLLMQVLSSKRVGGSCDERLGPR